MRIFALPFLHSIFLVQIFNLLNIQVNSEGDVVATVEDESAAGGKQQPLCRPVRKRARPAEQDAEEMEEDKEDSEEEDDDEAAAPARPGQPKKLPRYIHN